MSRRLFVPINFFHGQNYQNYPLQMPFSHIEKPEGRLTEIGLRIVLSPQEERKCLFHPQCNSRTPLDETKSNARNVLDADSRCVESFDLGLTSASNCLRVPRERIKYVDKYM